jgi:hypothetical protein
MNSKIPDYRFGLLVNPGSRPNVSADRRDERDSFTED